MLGALGKSRTVSEFLRLGYDVFQEYDGKSPFDLAVYRDNAFSRVECKSTATRTRHDTGWLVELKRVRANTKSNIIKNFDNTSCEFLSIYIEPIDRVIIIPASEITNKSQIAIRDSFVDTND